jgi:hypothetical protein
MGRNWYVHHTASDKSLSDLNFKSRKEAESFIRDNLQPDNPGWRTTTELGRGEMHDIYRAARAKHLGV